MYRAAYLFAVVAVVVLMLLEQYVPDQLMVLLLACAGIAHVWLTRRAVTTLLINERDDALSTFLRATSAVVHRTPIRSSRAPQSTPDQPQE